MVIFLDSLEYHLSGLRIPMASVGTSCYSNNPLKMLLWRPTLCCLQLLLFLFEMVISGTEYRVYCLTSLTLFFPSLGECC